MAGGGRVGGAVVAVILAVSAVALAGAAAAAGTTSGISDPAVDLEAALAARLGEERRARGLGGLGAAAALTDVARRHAARMMGEQRVFHHPSLAQEVDGWRLLGQAVGRGADVDQVHQAFMASEVHRGAILEPRFREMGVGVVRAGDGDVWATEVFREPLGAPPASTAGWAGPAPPAPGPSPRPATARAAARPATATTAAPATTTTVADARPPATAAPTPAPGLPLETLTRAAAVAPLAPAGLPVPGVAAAGLLWAVVVGMARFVLDPRRAGAAPAGPLGGRVGGP